MNSDEYFNVTTRTVTLGNTEWTIQFRAECATATNALVHRVSMYRLRREWYVESCVTRETPFGLKVSDLIELLNYVNTQ